MSNISRREKAKKGKSIGIPGLEPPQRVCTDTRCPWHGDISIRGHLFKGFVVSTSMQRTITVARYTVRKIKKYNRFERVTFKLHAHLPPCIDVANGDEVEIGECHKLAKTVSYIVLSVIKKAE